MKSRNQSIFEGAAFSFAIFYIINRLFSSSMFFASLVIEPFGYEIIEDSTEISALKGAIGLIVTSVTSGILTWLKIWSVNLWHLLGFFIGLILYVGYLTL